MKIRSVAAMLFAASLGISAVALAEHPPTALARAGVSRSGMSDMGKRAAAVVAKIRAQRGAAIRLAIPSAKAAPGPARSAGATAASTALHPPGVSPIPTDDADEDEGEPDCTTDSACLDEGELPAGTQSETAIAIDDSGQHVVIGFNDFRGFNDPNQLSISGFAYSDDGGKTFVDGGQLPDGPLDEFGFPQVFGDPDVKYLGACNFVYSSIMLVVKSFPGGLAVVQTMSVHRSRDCGHTWEGPFEVTSASNPSGLLDADGFPVDAADKEFIDVDRHTGRVLMTWTNFTDTSVAPGGTQILSTYSDDILSATPPTFSKANIISATAREGTGSIPRFGPEKNQAYVVWRRLPGGPTNSIAFAKTDDGGKTWSAPVEISAPFFIIDQILGNDRVHSFPGMAVDKSHEKTRGNIYVAWAGNDSHDGADIMVLRSNNGGKSFIGPVAINARPGGDRAQWFPAVSVDNDTGRVFIHYYDQGLTTSGDLTQVSYVFSDDGGKHWSPPLPLTDPFHGGWGNDTSQPNLGDYNQSVAQRGKYYPVFGLASRPPGGFVDGQPDLSMTVPDPKVQVLPASDHRFRAAPLDWQGQSFVDSGRNGHIDPGELVFLSVNLRNYVTNPDSKGKIEDVFARLSTSTPGVDVILPFSSWRDIKPGDTETNRFPFFLFTRSSFQAGTPIDLELEIFSDDHQTTILRHTIFTGTPQATVLVSESFDGSTSIPAGWRAVAQTGAAAINWRIEPGSPTSPGFCGTTSNGAFHVNTAGSAWQRLFSPAFAVPADSQWVTVEFDVCYDTEDEPLLNIWAYDGLFLRVTDLTGGTHTLRSVLTEAFEDQFTTDGFFGYPKHFPRNSDPAYFEDMSVWAGTSGGAFQHVRMRLPGMAGTIAQLRFEYAQDAFGTCADVRPGHSCGVIIDNVKVQSVKAAPKQP